MCYSIDSKILLFTDWTKIISNQQVKYQITIGNVYGVVGTEYMACC